MTRLPTALLVLLLLGGGLRLLGLRHGATDFVLPEQARLGIGRGFYSFHPDEETLVRAALRYGNLLEPPLTAYGSLPMLLARVWLGAASALQAGPAPDLSSPTGRASVFISVRVLAALLSWAALPLVWWLGRRSFGPWPAAIATLWVAAAPVALQQAHFYTVDTLFALLALVSYCMALRSLQSGLWLHYLVTGVLIGATAAVRLNGLLLGAVFLVGHLGAVPRDRGAPRLRWWVRRMRCPELWLAALGAAAALVALEPYLVLRPHLMWRVEDTDDFAYSLKVASGEILRPWSLADLHTTPYLHYWTHLWPQAVGWPLTLLLVAGVAGALRRRGQTRLLLLLWCALYFLGIGGLLTKHVRYLLPMLPFLALLAADAGTALCRRRIGVMAIAAVSLYTTAYGVAFARIYTTEDPRVQAGRWLAGNAPNGAAIGLESGGFSLQSVVSQERYRHRHVEAGWVFSTRGYLSCQATYGYLQEQLSGCDYLGIVDVNRYRQYTAAPELLPAGAEFYRRLVKGEMGFALVQEFTSRPSLLGWEFGGGHFEPSFVGYDHPAVWLFKRQDSFLSTWERRRGELDECEGCPDRALRDAAAFMLAQDLQPARTRLEQVTAAFPDLRYARLMHADVLRRQAQPAMAQSELSAYLTGFSDISYGAHLIPWAAGLSLVGLGLDDLALTALADGIQRKGWFQPQYLVPMADSYVHVANQLRQQDKRPTARQVYEMSLQLRPKPQAYNALAEMAAADGDQHGAIASWVKSLELDDSQVKVHADLGRTACGLGDFERGLRHLGRAADLDRVITPEERVGNYNNLAAEAQARGLQELAVSLWERSLGVAPDQPRVQALLGQLRPGSAAPRTSLDKPIR